MVAMVGRSTLRDSSSLHRSAVSEDHSGDATSQGPSTPRRKKGHSSRRGSDQNSEKTHSGHRVSDQTAERGHSGRRRSDQTSETSHSGHRLSDGTSEDGGQVKHCHSEDLGRRTKAARRNRHSDTKRLRTSKANPAQTSSGANAVNEADPNVDDTITVPAAAMVRRVYSETRRRLAHLTETKSSLGGSADQAEIQEEGSVDAEPDNSPRGKFLRAARAVHKATKETLTARNVANVVKSLTRERKALSEQEYKAQTSFDKQAADMWRELMAAREEGPDQETYKFNSLLEELMELRDSNNYDTATVKDVMAEVGELTRQLEGMYERLIEGLSDSEAVYAKLQTITKTMKDRFGKLGEGVKQVRTSLTGIAGTTLAAVAEEKRASLRTSLSGSVTMARASVKMQENMRKRRSLRVSRRSNKVQLAVKAERAFEVTGSAATSTEQSRNSFSVQSDSDGDESEGELGAQNAATAVARASREETEALWRQGAIILTLEKKMMDSLHQLHERMNQVSDAATRAGIQDPLVRERRSLKEELTAHQEMSAEEESGAFDEVLAQEVAVPMERKASPLPVRSIQPAMDWISEAYSGFKTDKGESPTVSTDPKRWLVKRALVPEFSEQPDLSSVDQRSTDFTFDLTEPPQDVAPEQLAREEKPPEGEPEEKSHQQVKLPWLRHPGRFLRRSCMSSVYGLKPRPPAPRRKELFHARPMRTLEEVLLVRQKKGLRLRCVTPSLEEAWNESYGCHEPPPSAHDIPLWDPGIRGITPSSSRGRVGFIL